MKKIINPIKGIDGRLFFAIILTMLLPSIYNTTKIFFIGDIPNIWGYNIASQIAWLNILYEILQEAILLPLFFIIGAVANNKRLVAQRLFWGAKLILPVYFVIASLIWLFTDSLVVFLNQEQALIELTSQYIKIETLTIPLRVIIDAVLTTLI
ncbi:MAG: hypothetical protein AB8B77_07860, partial [Alphaproteobacteria bacterium]